MCDDQEDTRGPACAQATRRAGRRARAPSDLTDAQWQVIAPHLPAQRPGRRGRPRIWPWRRIIEAILYLDRTGCAWRYLPADFPPWQTVYSCFAAWRDDGTLARLHEVLRTLARAAAGRKPQPTAAVIDSQSVRAADTVPRDSRGWDNAKKVDGRKRHIAVDTTGLVLDVVITAASVQDRIGARPLLWNTHRACRHVRLVWADAGYTGKLASWAASMKMTLQIVARRDPHTFEVLPRRWVVEADLRLDQQTPPHRSRLRAPARQPRSHDLVGHDRPHDQAPDPAPSEFHAVMKIIPDSHGPVLVPVSQSQFPHRDVIDAIGGAIPAAISTGGHDDRLLRTKPGHNEEVPRLAPDRLNRHLVPDRPSPLLSHHPIMAGPKGGSTPVEQIRQNLKIAQDRGHAPSSLHSTIPDLS